MRNTKYNYKHPYTVWENIKTDIETAIIKDVYGIGEKIPSINEICQEYKVSNNTAVKVLESLRNDEIILKKRGVGYFVKPYSKEVLTKKHKDEFISSLKKTIELGKRLGYEDKELLNEFKKYI